mmetsp:Transcript_73229/g.190757  ORF Transcript_73229/g.190757 Transcript_73229/m.190757 type:complete len:282 (+) Transcript_73229:212-1057(+)
MRRRLEGVTGTREKGRAVRKIGATAAARIGIGKVSSGTTASSGTNLVTTRSSGGKTSGRRQARSPPGVRRPRRERTRRSQRHRRRTAIPRRCGTCPTSMRMPTRADSTSGRSVISASTSRGQATVAKRRRCPRAPCVPWRRSSVSNWAQVHPQRSKPRRRLGSHASRCCLARRPRTRAWAASTAKSQSTVAAQIGPSADAGAARGKARARVVASALRKWTEVTKATVEIARKTLIEGSVVRTRRKSSASTARTTRGARQWRTMARTSQCESTVPWVVPWSR